MSQQSRQANASPLEKGSQEAWCIPIELNAGQDEEEETSLSSQDRMPHPTGISLVEVILLLSVSIAVLMAGVIMYSEIHDTQDVSEEANVINSAAGKIKALYASGDYDRLTTSDVLHGVFPSAMVSGQSLNNKWEGAITAEPSAGDASAATPSGIPDRYFKISYTNVPSKTCIKIAEILAPLWGVIKVNGVVIQNVYTSKTKIKQNNLVDACTAAPNVSMSFVSN